MVGPPFAGTELFQWGYRSRNNGVPSVVRWPSRFALLLPDRVLALLCGEIMDMNGPTIACGSSGHRVSVYENALGRLGYATGISPYEAANRRRLFSRRKISALFASHRRAAFSATASSTD